MTKTFTITNQPDLTKHEDGSDRADAAERCWLAEIFDDGGRSIDAAYFPTKERAESWVRDAHRIHG